jgi:putative endopeptidase
MNFGKKTKMSFRTAIRAALAAGTVLTLTAAGPIGKPQLGEFGFDRAGQDTAVAPGQDFYGYANGGWDKTTQIPADKARFGMFDVLDDLSKTRTRAILEGEAAGQGRGTPGRKAADYYHAFMDEGAIEARGAAPLQAELRAVASIDSPQTLAHTMGTLERTGVSTAFDYGVDVDEKDPDAYIPALRQGGLGLPDRDYYLKDDPAIVTVRGKYKAHIAKMLALAGYPDPQGNAERIFALETEIAHVHWTRVESRQAEKTYNKLSQSALAAAAPGFAWNSFAEAAGLASQPNLIVGEPSAIAGEARLLAATPLPTVKAYLAYKLIEARADVLPKAFVDERFDFYGRALSGTPELKVRWKRGVEQTSGALGEAIGQIYVAHYFPPAAKASADQLVHNILTAMNARLQHIPWMDAATREKAVVKLAAFKPKIGYPEKWRDYTRLDVRPDDAYGNKVRANTFEWDREQRRLGQPTDRGEWGMTPMTINAYANPVWNEIVFPAAILQPPFFDPNADPAVNYGAIGVVIGHEISHHFDDQGRKFDPTGRLADWWTPGDIERFAKLTDRLAAQYDKYEPLPGLHVQGKLTLGENIADVVGLQVAHDAYLRSLHGRPAPVIDGMTGDQRFYLGFAQVWREKQRDAALRRQLLSDPHSPGQQRADAVRNLDPWYAAFKPKPGEALYLAPGDRVKIW